MHGYYINLDERQDRRAYFEQYIKNTYAFFSQIQRFSAFKHNIGSIGCALSHYSAIEKAFDDSNEELIFILEDDFSIINPRIFASFLNNFERIKTSSDWDCIVLTPSGNKIPGSSFLESNHFLRINNNQTATAYIIKRGFAKLLAQTIRMGREKMLAGEHPDQWANDQVWKLLQNDYSFYYYNSVFATQLPCYSSIEKRDVDYTPRFIAQNLK